MDSTRSEEEKLDIDVQSFFDSAPYLRNSTIISDKIKEFIDHNSQSSGKYAMLYII